MSGSQPHLEPLTTGALADAGALVAASVESPAIASRLASLLADAAHDGDPGEYRALVARDGGTVVAVVSFGLVSGAESSAALHGIATLATHRRRGIARALLRETAAAMHAAGASALFAELPDERALAPAARTLERAGYVEVGRVPDLVRDGVALRVLRTSLPGTAG